MVRVFKNLADLIGKTPLLELSNYKKEHELQTTVIDKLEYLNPAGSVKDKIAKMMIEDAEEKGLLNPESVITEPASRNAGIGLASVAAVHGYHTILTMPGAMGAKRRNLSKAYGAELILIEDTKGMSGATARAEELAQEIPYPFIPGQFVNPVNPDVHRKTTGPEIWKDTDGKVDILVAGVSTGGTLTGAGELLKSKNPNVRVIAVEPDASPVSSESKSGLHKAQGIGVGFAPKVFNTSIYDEIIRVKNEDTSAIGRGLFREGGLLVGISPGVAVWAATELVKRPGNASKVITTILSDTGEWYLPIPLLSKQLF